MGGQASKKKPAPAVPLPSVEEILERIDNGDKVAAEILWNLIDVAECTPDNVDASKTIGQENDTITALPGTLVAYGLPGKGFVFKMVDGSGKLSLDNDTMGSDPVPGEQKFAYLVKPGTISGQEFAVTCKEVSEEVEADIARMTDVAKLKKLATAMAKHYVRATLDPDGNGAITKEEFLPRIEQLMNCDE